MPDGTEGADFEVVTEYAVMRGGTVVVGPYRNDLWNGHTYPGGEVVSRTRTIRPDIIASWQVVTPSGEPS